MYSYHSATVESDSGNKLSDGVIVSFACDQMSIHLNNTDKIKINETLIINIFTKTNGCIIYKGIAKALYNNANNRLRYFYRRKTKKEKSQNDCKHTSSCKTYKQR